MNDDTQRISLCPQTCQETVISLRERTKDLEERAEKHDTQIEAIKTDVNDMKVSAAVVASGVERIEEKLGGIGKGVWTLVGGAIVSLITVFGTWALGKF